MIASRRSAVTPPWTNDMISEPSRAAWFFAVSSASSPVQGAPPRVRVAGATSARVTNSYALATDTAATEPP